MIEEKDIVEIGQYNKPHGVNGEISATFMCDVDEIPSFSTLISSMDGIFVPFFVSNVRPKNDRTVLLRLDGVNSEQDVRRFVNKRIYVLRHELSEGDDVYCDYFIGYDILTPEGKYVGRIVDVDDSTENALFIVENEDSEFMIPIAEEFFVSIDEEEKRLTLDLPHGIIGMQVNGKD